MSNHPQRTGPDIFWGEISPCEHFLQIYERDEEFLDSLEGFVAGGFHMDESVIVIATQEHLAALDDRLDATGIDVDAMRENSQYFSFDAEKALARFIVNGWPDERKFRESVGGMLNHARQKGRKVRAFGEMVALLWAQGHKAATVRLEHLWQAYYAEQEFSLFCAYPKSGFTEDAVQSVRTICATHSRLVSI